MFLWVLLSIRGSSPLSLKILFYSFPPFSMPCYPLLQLTINFYCHFQFMAPGLRLVNPRNISWRHLFSQRKKMTLLDLVSWIIWGFSPLLVGPSRLLFYAVAVGSNALRTLEPLDLSNPGEHFFKPKICILQLCNNKLGGIPQISNVLP